MVSDNVRRAHVEVSEALERLAKLFTNDCRVLFVMTKPGSPEGFMVVGDENFDDAIDAIRRAKAKLDAR